MQKPKTINPFQRSKPGIKADRTVLDLIKTIDKSKRAPKAGKLSGKFPPNFPKFPK